MKRTIALLSFVLFTAAVLAFAADDTGTELRPSQKLMRARKAWLSSIIENIGSGRFDAIAKDAEELAAQTKKVGENIPNPLGKELTLAISSFSKEISASAAKQDGAAIKIKLGEISEKCGECHVKIRDKK
ncbi:MAG: hypothetical protein QG578_2029 [Thermodesulfobacteriota bacterium]|nr:hypothetical protein [Thermodesulfobacteriota bacterium]